MTTVPVLTVHCCSSHVPEEPGVPLYPAAWLGEGREIAACCDPNDCGPCCPDCPTCPTLRAERASA